jgi:cobalt-zinc-cadmium efflux system outer membrane protein
MKKMSVERGELREGNYPQRAGGSRRVEANPPYLGTVPANGGMCSWLAIVVSLLTSAPTMFLGCARFHEEPVSAGKNLRDLESRSLANPQLKAFVETNVHRAYTPWPPVSWDLEMLTLVAFYYQPELAVARAQWEVTQAGEKTAGQRPNPTVSVSPGLNATTVMNSPWLVTSSLDVPIETAGKRGYRREQAAHLAEAARWNIATTAWQVRSNVRSALLDLVAGGHRVEALGRQVALQEQLVERQRAQLQAGAISSSEGLPARIALTRAKLDLADAQRQQTEAHSRLAEALGVPVRALEDAHFEFQFHTSKMMEFTSAEVRRAALQSRADILGALSEYAAAESALHLEIAKQWPDIHLQPGYEFDQGDSKWSIGLSLELPVLNQNQGPIAEAEARRKESAAKFIALQAKIMAELGRTVELFRISQTNVAALESLAAAQAEREHSTEAQLKAGAADRLELLNAQLESAAAAVVVLDAEIKVQQAAGALEAATQQALVLPKEVFESTAQRPSPANYAK